MQSDVSARLLQKFDWIKDMTPEEEALMKERRWDCEDTALGPVERRYVQPALKVLQEDHDNTLRTARAADRVARSYSDGAEARTACLSAGAAFGGECR